MKMAEWNPMRQRYMYVQKLKLKNEERLVINELKALMINNEAKEYLPFEKVDQRKLRDVTKKVNAVIKHIETDDVTQTNLLWQHPFELQQTLE